MHPKLAVLQARSKEARRPLVINVRCCHRRSEGGEREFEAAGAE